MYGLLTLLKKEFRQIFRNRLMIPVIFVVPVVQMILLVYAANLEMKNIDIVVVDQDLSEASRGLTANFSASPFFTMKGNLTNYQEAERMIIRDEADVILRFQHGFEKKLINENYTQVQLIVNAINATQAGLANAYCSQIISNYNSKVRSEWFGLEAGDRLISLNFSVAYWYNSLLDYKIYMFSGILVILVTLIGMMLTAINLVTEKELGTAEQMNVTPIRKYQFILAKLLPFLIIALFELAFGLLVGKLLVDLPTRGSLVLLFGVATAYLVVALGIGLFLSTISNTQQQMMFVAFFFMITFILMSGVFTPTESMPLWAQKLNLLNPMAYFMKAIRMILLKGSGFTDVSREFYSLLIYGVLMLTLAITNYRKTT